MEQSLSVAVIGTGFIGPVHIEAIRRAGAHVVGVLGSSLDKSRVCADRMRVPRAYGHLDELLADTSIDVVHIASPNRVHFEQVSQCLDAGKHVLCEKPLAMNSTESGKLVEMARATGLACAVNYNIRYYPLCIEAQVRCQSEQFGKVFHVVGSYVQDWLLRATDFNWRVQTDHGGPLRAVADIGTHWMDLVQLITGQRVREVCANLSTVHASRLRTTGGSETFTQGKATDERKEPIAIDTEDCGAVMLRFEGGATGVLWVSQVTAGRKNCLRFEIGGALQSIAWNSELPNEIWIGHRDQPNQLLVRDPALLSPQAARFAHYPGGHNEGFPDTFKQLFTDFYGSIVSGSFRRTATYPNFLDGHREILLCEAILQSARAGGWVSVGESNYQ